MVTSVFPSELALFLCGAGAYKIFREVRANQMKANNWVGLVLLGISGGAALLINRDPSGWVLLNIGIVVLIILVLPFLFKLTQGWKIDNYFGELSYPMYLCHTLVIWLLALMHIQDGIGKGIGILSMTFGLSIILYWYVDRKVDNYRHRKFLIAKT